MLNPYQDDPNNPDNPANKLGNDESIFYQNPTTGTYDNINGLNALATQIQSLTNPTGQSSAAPAGVGLGTSSAPASTVPTIASTTPTWQPTAMGLGKLGLSALANRGAGRAAEAGINQNQDKIGLDAARLNLQAPGMRARNAAQGDVLANGQDASVSGVPSYINVPKISGGLRPSLFSPNTRALGSDMSRRALLSQLSGPAFTPTGLPQSSGLDTGLAAGGYGAVIAALLGQYFKGGGGNTGGDMGTPL